MARYIDKMKLTRFEFTLQLSQESQMEIITQSVTTEPFSLSGLDAIRFDLFNSKTFK